MARLLGTCDQWQSPHLKWWCCDNWVELNPQPDPADAGVATVLPPFPEEKR